MASRIGRQKAANAAPNVIASAIADRGFTTETAEAVSTAACPPSLQAGQFVRWTITLLPQRRRRVQAIADELSAEVSALQDAPVQVPLLTLARWLIDKGIEAYERGERPAFETKLRLK